MFYQCFRSNRRPNMGMFDKIVITSVFLLFSLLSPLSIAEPQSTTLNLSTAFKQAIQQNPSLKMFKFKDEVLQGNLQTADLKPQYKLGVGAEQFAGTGELSGVDGLELTVSLSSVIEMGGKRASRGGIVSSKRNILVTNQQIQSLDLLGQVTRSYVELLSGAEKVSLAKDALQLASKALTIVKKRAEAGATPKVEVKRALAAKAQAKLALASESQQLEYRKVALASLWGARAFSYQKVAGDLFNFGQDIDFETLYNKVQTNPMIQLFADQQRLDDAQVRLAKTQSSADLSWSVGLRQTQENNDISIVAGFSMPLMSSSRSRGAITSATAKRSQTFVEKEVALINIHNQLYRAFYNRKQAILAVTQLKKIIVPQLEQAMEGTLFAYQQGRYGYLDTVSARQELLSAKRSLIQAATAALKYGAEIEQLTAEPLAASQYGQPIEFTGIKQ